MCNYGMLATLVVLTCIHNIYGDSNNTSINETATKNNTNHTFHSLDFWDNGTKFETTKRSLSLRKTPLPDAPDTNFERFVLDAFLHNINSNKSVFRYSEIKHFNSKHTMERAIKNLPAIMDMVLVSNQSKSDPTSTSKRVLKSDVTPNNNARRTTFERLFVWSRDPVFDVKPTQSSRIPNDVERYEQRQRKLRERDKQRIHGHYADLRHRVNAARRMAMSLTYNRRMLNKKPHKHGPNHRPKNSEEFESRKSPNVNNAIAPPNMNGTNITILRSKDEEPKKEPNPLSPYSLFKQIKTELIPKLEKMGANISIDVLGRTLEYNDIVMIKATCQEDEKRFRVNDKFDDVPPEKKIVLIIHGLSVMGYNSLPCLRTVDGLTNLISFYYKHLDQFDIFVIPMANPDGVSAAVAKGYWNKNISPQSACPGVALDRNFDVAWNGTPCTISSCSQQFPGPEPFSELETQVVREVFHKYSHRIIGYFHVHSSSYTYEVFKGDGVLYPKGYSDASSDDDKYIDIKGEIDEMMKNASFKVYSVSMETLHTWYGKVSGTSVDFASSVYGVPFAMEFAMQLYQDDPMVDSSKERETFVVLNEVWSGVIDIVFNFMFKSLKTVDSK